MIAICSAVYVYMLKQVVINLKNSDLTTDQATELVAEPEEVYMRFAGAACITDKSNLPQPLFYRDRGGLYFPDKALLPFVQSLDDCIREFANEQGFRRYGKHLVKIS